MKTIIVYVLVSSDKDFYLEQLWASVYSLKHFTPSARIKVLTDEETNRRFLDDKYEELGGYIDEVVPVPFDSSISGKERSRWIKTNMRSLITGDFLFLDTDTIVTSDLSEVDYLKMNVGIVLDLHCQFISHPFESSIRKKIQRLFGGELKPSTNYYNSGVIFAKDSQESHQFFEKWHENWQKAKDKVGGVQDQQSLVVTINELGVVEDLDGVYNCQILGSIEYLVNAKIVHFFNTQWADNTLSDFFGDEIYKQIRKDGGVSEDTERLILNCKSSFVSPSMPIGLEDMKLWLTPSFKLLRLAKKRNTLYFKVHNRISRYILKHFIKS